MTLYCQSALFVSCINLFPQALKKAITLQPSNHKLWNSLGVVTASKGNDARVIGTFRSEGEDDYEYEFSVLNMRIRFGGRHFSKCACSE